MLSNKRDKLMQCPNCHHTNTESAIYCEGCGLWLADLDSTSEHYLGSVTEALGAVRTIRAGDRDIDVRPDEFVLLFPHTDNSLILPKSESLILGRSAQPFAAPPNFVDLSPFEAMERGVSRQHANIDYRNDQYVLVDHESANGTYLNKQRLEPGQDYPLKNGDLILLARFACVFYCGEEEAD